MPSADNSSTPKRARKVPIIEEARELVATRLAVVHEDDGRLFTGPRGGRITTAVLRDATHWDEVVTRLGYEHLRRHDLRHVDRSKQLDLLAEAREEVRVAQQPEVVRGSR